MKNTKKTVLALACLVAFLLLSQAQTTKTDTITLGKEWIELLDKDLTHWEKWIGVPHTSVELEGYEKNDDYNKGTPLGLNIDPKNVMSMQEIDGELLLYITGEIYGGLTTLQEFGNYHLKAVFKWGEKKWAPRLDQKRDNGILYHCKGEHGAFWNVWMSSLECQVQETDMGDFISLVNTQADVACKKEGDIFKYTPEESNLLPQGYVHIVGHNEFPNGEWNTIEVITVGDKSIHVVNGKVLMVIHNTRHKVGDEYQTLTNGKIQLQSEAAEAYYKSVTIKSVKDFPKEYKKQAGL